MTHDMRKDAIYARQSVDKADSISIESQIEFCRYETRGAPCLIFADKGYSGKNTDRPEFQQMLRKIRCGAIRRVICYKLDRCSRSILDFTTLMEELRNYDVEFVSCTEKFDTSTPMGRAMLNICIVFAQLERETIQQRVRDAYHSRSKKGFYMGGKVPFGFCREACTVEGKRTSRFREEPGEAAILHFLYQHYSRPSVSLGDLVAVLQKRGIPNPRRSDGLWVRSHIGRMLANPVYVKADMALYRYFKEKGVTICNELEDFIGTNGCYLYSEPEGGKSLVIAPHEGLVPSELWLKCREKHTWKQKKNTAGMPQSNWLTGKLLCAKCGNPLVFSSKTGKNGTQYRYIVCPHAHGAARCCTGLRGWKAETAEQLLSSLLKTCLKTCYPTLTRQKDSRNQNGVDITIAQIPCEIEKAAANTQKTGGQLPDQKKIRTHSSREIHREQICQPDYDSAWELLSPQEKRLVADILIHSVELSENAMTVTWRGPFLGSVYPSVN